MVTKKSNSDVLLWVARILVGLLFIFSGLIKMNDPLGFGYKLEEYFDVFKMSFLNPLVTPIAVFLCALEIVLGVMLLFGVYARKVALGLLLLIIFFTFLTFVSAAFKVVTSCGCFGDAIPLTPWQSFTKDLILLVLIVYIYIKRGAITSFSQNKRNKNIVVFGATLLSLAFGIYTLNFLPVLDFLPYKVGANIPNLMVVPPGAQPDEYQILYHLKHKQTAEEKDMSDKEYLKTEIWKDDNWEIIGTPAKKLIKEGFKPKISDLIINDASGTNYTKEIIENPYYNLLIVAYNLGDADEKAVAKLNALALNAAEEFNIRTVFLTSSGPEMTAAFTKKLKLFPEVFFADGVPLKSMVRANPGVLLLKNGVVVNKWHYHNTPSFDALSETYFRN